MKNVAIPLFRDVRYSGRVISCDFNGFLFEYEDSVYSMKLFNIMLNDAGKREVCSFLSGEVDVEIDASASFTGRTEVYVFIEDELLQKQLIEENLARIHLRNPEFKYYNEMMFSSVQEVNVSGEIGESGREFDRTRANYFWFINFILIMLVMIGFGVRKKVKKSIK